MVFLERGRVVRDIIGEVGRDYVVWSFGSFQRVEKELEVGRKGSDQSSLGFIVIYQESDNDDVVKGNVLC